MTKDSKIFEPLLRNAKLTRLRQRLLDNGSNILNHCCYLGRSPPPRIRTAAKTM
jgi:hypothetical protein